MKKLFIDKERLDTTQPLHMESEYDFLDRYNSVEVEGVRQQLNTWFSKYPKSEQNELRIRLKNSFSTALYELFIYELFTQQGFKLYIHPKVSGSNKRPDFLAIKDGIELYIEATEASEFSQEEKGVENKTKTLYDAINTINTPLFFISLLEHRFKSTKQPNGNLIVSHFEKEINKFSVEDIQKNLSGDYEDRIKIRYENEDMLIVISLLPKPPQLIGVKNVRPIGMYASEEYFGPEDSIKKSIVKKARKYGELDKPLIVCVNSRSSLGINAYTVCDILFGHLALSWSTEPGNKDEKAQRQWQGVFGNPKNPKIRRASGVLITGLNLGTVFNPKHWFTKHPFAKNPIDFEVFSLTYNHVEENKIKVVSKKTIIEILQ